MAPTFGDFMQSDPFTFLIGQEGKSIVAHSAAIAAASQQLDALVNGGMEESKTRCAKIADIEVDDFIRFCEYAYRGDYTVPPPHEMPPEPISTSGENQENEIWGSWEPKMHIKKKKGKKREVAFTESESLPYPGPPFELNFSPAPPPMEPEYPQEVEPISRTHLRTQFNSQNYLHDGDPKALILQHFEPKSNTAVNQDFTPVLLAHARLYCFAHLHLIAPLKALTLSKLHKTLMDFKLYTKRIGDIIELARYAYANPDLPGRSDDGTLDDLRKLVVDYIVCEIDTIGESDGFVKYMEEGGEFVGDFWKLTRDYIS